MMTVDDDDSMDTDKIDRKTSIISAKSHSDEIPFEEKIAQNIVSNPLVDLKRVIMSTRTGRDACYRKSSDEKRPPFKVTSTELVEIAEDLIETGGHDGSMIELWMTTNADLMSSL